VNTLWTRRDVETPAATVWGVLTDPDQWPVWGPTVRRVELHGDRLELGATGTVTTIVGVDLGFEVTAFEPGTRWAWKVAGLAATDHRVESLGVARCRVGFGVPWLMAPYLAVCRLALERIDALARQSTVTS
jgi:uncharacterized protein YndB with AHSA1/START domain